MKRLLQQEQRKLKLVIKQQEIALRHRVQKLPGELFHAGADAIVPTILSGKITASFLNTGRSLINKAVDSKINGNTARLVTAIRQAGIFTLLRLPRMLLLKSADKLLKTCPRMAAD